MKREKEETLKLNAKKKKQQEEEQVALEKPPTDSSAVAPKKRNWWDQSLDVGGATSLLRRPRLHLHLHRIGTYLIPLLALGLTCPISHEDIANNFQIPLSH